MSPLVVMQLTKNLLKWFELHPKWFVFLFIIYAIFVGGAGWVMPYLSPDKVTCNPLISCPNQDALGKGTSNNAPGPNCRTENFDASRWKTGDYRENTQGYWCPKGVWEDPVIWYSDGIRPGFTSIFIEYETMKDGNISTSNPPSFITAYGKETPVFKSWTTEGVNFQLFRFAKNLDLSRKVLTPNLAEDLPDPVKLYQKDSFAIT